jgi:hypothetical protein
MKYTVEIGSGAVMYVSKSHKDFLGIQKLMGDTDTESMQIA